jgi:hypothetical protein
MEPIYFFYSTVWGGIDVIDPDFEAKLIENNVCPMCHNKSLLPSTESRDIGVIDPDFWAKLIEINVCPCVTQLKPTSRQPRAQT